MDKIEGKFSVSLQVLVSGAIVAGMALLSLVIMGQSYQNNRQALINSAQRDAQNVAEVIDLKIQGFTQPTISTIKLLEFDPLISATSHAERLERLPVLAQTLESSPIISAVYAGYADGDFFLLRRLERSSVKEKLNAPSTAYYLLQSIERKNNGEVTLSRWEFYDKSLQVLTSYQPKSQDFDPRTRPWFKKAIRSDEPFFTSPYVFFTTRQIGITLASENKTTGTVIGIDASIGDLSKLIKSLQPSPLNYMVLVEGLKKAIAYAEPEHIILTDSLGGLRLADVSELKIPALTHLLEDESIGSRMETFRLEGKVWYGLKVDVKNERSGRWRLLFAIPEEVLLEKANIRLTQALFWSVLIMLILLVIGWVLGNLIARPLLQLTTDVGKITRFDFKNFTEIDTPIKEVRELSALISKMAQGIDGFKSISRTLSRETDLDRMLTEVVDDLTQVTLANTGVVYFYNEESSSLSLTTKVTLEIPQEIGCKNSDTSAIIDRLTDILEPLPGSHLATPLLDREGDLIGVLVLIFTDYQLADQSYFKQFVEEVSGSAATAITTRRQVEEQEELLNSIIRLLADAIDAKSPYTSGHCERVPKLAEMMIDAAERSSLPSFSGFEMTEKEKREFRIAAWLHDCGKVTIPEYVVDKATKLETINNRIHEVRMRFEVLWRDAELEYWKGVSEGGDKAELRRQCDLLQSQLKEEFEWVAQANVGGEFMSDEDIARLQQIAVREWMRYFDNSIGLSNAESDRLTSQDTELPKREFLLDDRNDHIIPWGTRRPAVEKDDPENLWGFDMTLPEHEFNKGELYNLSIRAGTLTSEERFSINNHIVQTIKMLNALPFSKDLKRVPEIAGNHHEKVDGTGYPRKLNAGELSVAERVMSVADIFEALTAGDRPYKKGKNLSEAVRILAFMARDKHVDADVFQLFLESEAYLSYADQYLDSAQIDSVDVEAMLKIVR